MVGRGQADEEFLWLGNHPATDLCNTTPVVGGQPIELLGDISAVVRWARAAGASDVEGHEIVAGRATTGWVHRLRAAARVALEAGPPATGPIGALNDVIAGERAALHVDWRGAEAVSLRAGRADRQLRVDIAAAVTDIFRHDPARVRRCAAPECVLLYLDVSKGGRRRWCDMATCGNRAKAATHHARSRRR
jgi:predicted RNA-binding Zn ribbon-like protein